MRDEDQTVVEAVRGGRTEAFRLLVERHKGRLYSIIFKLVGDPELAEELTQDAFVRAYSGLGAFRGEARFGTWLVQIGLHTVRDHVRRRHRRRRREIPLDSLSHDGEGTLLVERSRASDPLVQLGDAELRERVARALDGLPPEYREVIVLKHFEGLPYGEIAGLTGVSVGALKVRAHRARRMLREELTRKEGSHPALRVVAAGKEVGRHEAD